MPWPVITFVAFCSYALFFSSFLTISVLGDLSAGIAREGIVCSLRSKIISTIVFPAPSQNGNDSDIYTSYPNAGFTGSLINSAWPLISTLASQAVHTAEVPQQVSVKGSGIVSTSYGLDSSFYSTVAGTDAAIPTYSAKTSAPSFSIIDLSSVVGITSSHVSATASTSFGFDETASVTATSTYFSIFPSNTATAETYPLTGVQRGPFRCDPGLFIEAGGDLYNLTCGYQAAGNRIFSGFYDNVMQCAKKCSSVRDSGTESCDAVIFNQKLLAKRIDKRAPVNCYGLTDVTGTDVKTLIDSAFYIPRSYKIIPGGIEIGPYLSQPSFLSTAPIAAPTDTFSEGQAAPTVTTTPNFYSPYIPPTSSTSSQDVSTTDSASIQPNSSPYPPASSVSNVASSSAPSSTSRAVPSQSSFVTGGSSSFPSPVLLTSSDSSLSQTTGSTSSSASARTSPASSSTTVSGNPQSSPGSFASTVSSNSVITTTSISTTGLTVPSVSLALSTSTTSTTSSQTGPNVVQTAGTFAYKGCYSEGTSSRALSGKATALNTMSVEYCASFCVGFQYMGVEYG